MSHQNGTAERAGPGGSPGGPGGRFDLAALVAREHEHLLDLHAAHINAAFVSMLRTIGFDRRYVRGEGAYLFDDRGRRYIDCLGGYAVFTLGRNHPAVRDALKQALDMDLPNLPGVGAFRLAPLLARELAAIAPGDLPCVYFASGGGEAIDAAIKFARLATGRAKIVHCHRSYHGLTVGGLSITANHEFREGCGPLLEGMVEVPFNDLPSLEEALSRPDVAAFVVEPIQGKGVNMPGAEYLREAARLCARRGTLLVLDEIQTGMGRTGRWWACEHFGAGRGVGDWQPDMVVVAKGLSGGYMPTSAVLSRRWISDEVFPGMRECAKVQNTFSMNDLSMAAGLATLHTMRAEGTVAHAGAVGERLIAGLRGALAGMEMVKEVRGKGLMVGLEFTRPRSMGLKVSWDLLHKLDPSLFCQAVIMPLMGDHRILAQVAGHRLDVIKLIPPLVLSEADADEVVRAFAKTVGDCHRAAGPAWEVGKRLGAAAMRKRPAPSERGAGGEEARVRPAASA